MSLRKVKLQHSLVNHYLPLYFPEAEKYLYTTRAQWFTNFLFHFPNPAAVIKYTLEEFIQAAWVIAGRKVNKRGWLIDFYYSAQESIGLPVPEDSKAIHMFKLILKDHQELCCRLKELETLAETYLKENPDYQHLRTIPGIGPILALTILAEAGDLGSKSYFDSFLKEIIEEQLFRRSSIEEINEVTREPGLIKPVEQTNNEIHSFMQKKTYLKMRNKTSSKVS